MFCGRGTSQEKRIWLYFNTEQMWTPRGHSFSEASGGHLKEKVGRKVLKRGAAACGSRALNPIPILHQPAGSENEVTQVNRCLDAAKACNVDEMCQRLRTEYVSFCIRRLARADTCNRSKCHKALRKFFDRVPPEYTHELLFCPCEDTACAERRRQTIVPACSYESKEKPNCLAPLDSCRENYVCRYVHCGGVGDMERRRPTKPGVLQLGAARCAELCIFL